MRLFAIGFFGLLGVFSRYFAGQWALRQLGSSFPYGTLLVNVVGCFLIGAVAVAGTERGTIPPDLRLGLMVGFLGGFTTFSSYSLESMRLLQAGQWLSAAGYFIGSPLVGLMATGLGMSLARWAHP